MSSTPSPMEELRAIHDAQHTLMEKLVRALTKRRSQNHAEDEGQRGGASTNRTATP